MFGWGSNQHGELCEISMRGLSQPTEIQSLEGFSALYCGRNYVVGMASSSIYKTLDDTSFSSQRTLETDPEKEVTELRKENRLLREAIRQLQSNTDSELSHKYTALAEEHTRLKGRLSAQEADLC